MKIKLLIFAFIFFQYYCIGQSQELISTSGNNFNDGTIETSWSIGEVLVQTATNENNELTQGFHQSNIILTKLDELLEDDMDVIVYPNPAVDVVHINMKDRNLSLVAYKLYDLRGKLLMSKSDVGLSTEINLQNLPSSFYLLHVYSNGRTISKFKVQKLK